MKINEIAKKINDNAKAKGFWDNERNIGEMLCLIHSEVSEALEADRKNRYANLKKLSISNILGQDDGEFIHAFKSVAKDTFEDELADVCIRVFDLAYAKGIDLESHIRMKHRYNTTREHMHGKKY